MKKITVNNKGSSLVMVIIVIMVVSILAGALIDTSLQNFKLSKRSGYMDYSYYAGESIIQKCWDALNTKCNNRDLAALNHITYNGNNDVFSKKIVKQVLTTYINELSGKNYFRNIDITDNASNTANATVSLKYMGFRYNPMSEPNIIYIKVGITADTSYDVKLYTSGDKKVFASKEFAVYIPQGFKLKGPVYSIGDLMADGGSKVKILGDVHVYGTSPEYLKQPEQYYYGGIYSKSNSEIRIEGNAYSRSFIRTGQYSSAEDKSLIYVYKDAVAQCIQAFGKSNRIAVMRNAYTFDDIEMNGEDSVIAVNGSYFGLSDGADGSYHDNSSAIVNSAGIHHDNSEDSQKSRIIINGAVMLNGGTFRIDPNSGDALYQIEDASLAWLTDSLNMIPVYKTSPLDLNYPYINWLTERNYQLMAKGFGNLFQVWNPVDITGIDTWFSRIDAARKAGSNDNNNFDNKIVPGKIQGFSNYVMAANDRMYLMEKDSESGSELEKAIILKNSYVLDNIAPPTGLTDWSKFWDDYVDGGYAWNGGYCTTVPAVLDDVLKPRLLDMANIFINRYNNYDSNKMNVEHQSGQVFKSIQDSLDYLVATSATNRYIIVPATGNLSDPVYAYNDLINNPWAENKYFLVVNEDPEKVLVLDNTTFNGVIFTTGKVILKNNAVVNGAIIAAGKGYDPDSSTAYISGSAAETKDVGGINMAFRAPRIKKNGSNLGVLDSGGYAGVYCTNGSESINFPDPDPDIGRAMLLEKFKTQDAPDMTYSIELSNIF
jgi:hypothetical protein